MFFKNTSKINISILIILILNLVLTALFLSPMQAQAKCLKNGEWIDNCHSCNSAGECVSDPDGPYWCAQCFGKCGLSSDSSGTVSDVDYEQALDIATNILSEQEGSGANIINAVTSGQSDTIISGLATAYCASLGIPPAICTIALNILLSPGAGVGGTGDFTQTQKFKAPTLGQYKWEVGIPGFVAKDGVVPLEGEGVSDLIKAIIAWAFKLAGVLAFIMIVYAGFQYLVSGGNTAQQKDAQERIVSVIIGIVLLFAFYIILYTINPNILNTSL